MESKQQGVAPKGVKPEHTLRMEFVGTYDPELRADTRK
jgi:hypothetical protein